ncbi:hypothetical protein [Achromobacter kerstersii]
MEGLPFDSELPVLLLITCGEIFAHPPLSERAVKVYFQAVGCSDVDLLSVALKVAIREGDRFPAPGELRRILAAQSQRGREPSHA